jgi:2-dehydro-3-deoxygalactonokinase
MNYFISCDWGSSSFRLRLVDRQREQVLGEVTGKTGIFGMFEGWRQSGQVQEKKLAFYQAALQDGIDRLQRQMIDPLADLPLVLSGMASSSMGMMELPYQPVPFDRTGSDLYRVEIPASEDFRRSILLVSGVRTERDVMRGEETQLVGCVGQDVAGEGGGVPGDERIYLFPGTHSKHVRVKGGRVVDFSTFMTGEFFQLLATKSVLAASVSPEEPPGEEPGPVAGKGWRVPPAFEQGVQDSQRSSLLHNAFLVRARQLLEKVSKDDNYYYLSGLLIGEELKQLAGAGGVPTGVGAPLTIVAAGRMKEYYPAACHQLGMTGIEVLDADRALVLGHCRLLNLPTAPANLRTDVRGGGRNADME